MGGQRWPDYVFNDDYQLDPLEQVETYIKENNRLPGIPSADHADQEGISVATMITKQMQKIEELTLYMIEIKKENDALKERIGSLEQSANEMHQANEGHCNHAIYLWLNRQ